MKRRSLIGASLLTAPSLVFCQKMRREEETDVVIVGGGVGGLTAAVSCSEKGFRVILLEKMSFLGGDSLKSGGYFNAVTEEAEKNGTDSIELYKEQIFESGGGFSDPEVVSILAEKSGDSLKWLKSQGIRFMEAPRHIYGSLWRRAYKPLLPSGTGYIQVLTNNCYKKGVDIRTSSKVTELIKHKISGAIVGVSVEKNGSRYEVKAKRGVVLAAGGFGANKELLKRSSEILAGLGTDSHPGATGDLLPLAAKVGAKIQNLQFVECVPGGDETFSDPIRLDYDPGKIIFVDDKGDRFIEETSPRSNIFEKYKKNKIKHCYTIADSRVVESIDVMRRKHLYRGLYSGLAWRKDSIEELAACLGLDAARLRRSAQKLQNEGLLNQPPFWAVKVVFRIHTTLGGVCIDKYARVLDVEGRPIRSLYACGQIIGNLHGKNRLGGNGLNSAVVFARVAAETISESL